MNRSAGSVPKARGWVVGLCVGLCLGMVGLLLGCESLPLAPSARSSGQPVESLLSSDVSLQRERVEAPYRLSLDSRIPRAFRGIHEMLGGGSPALFTVTREGQRQVVLQDQEKVAEFDEFTGIFRSKEPLQKYAEKLNPELFSEAKAPPASGGQETPWLEPIENSLSRLRSVVGLESSEIWTPNVAPRVAKALINLCFQATDTMGTADELCARAWAASALASKVSPASMREAEALLAYTLGYEAEALEASKGFEAGHPLRLFLSRDHESLRRLALSRQASFEARLFWLIRLNESGDLVQENTFRLRAFPGEQLTTPVLLARLRTPAPLLGAPLGQAIPSLLLLNAEADAQNPKAVLLKAGVRNSSARPEELLDAATAIQQMLVAKEQSVFEAYEALVEQLSQRVQVSDAFGPSATRSFYLTSMFSALRARVTAVSGLDVADLELRNARLDALGDFVAWHDLIFAPKRKAKASEVLKLAKKLREVGALGWERLFVALHGAVSPGSEAEYQLVRALFARLDSRPMHRWMAAGVVGVALSDSILREKLLSAAVEASPDAYPGLSLWFFRYQREQKKLVDYATDVQKPLGHRARALFELSKMNLQPPSEMQQHFESLLSDSGDDWEARSVYLEYLQGAQEWDKALEVARGWLVPDPRSGSQTLITARTEAALILMHKGRLPEAWKLIEPLVDGMQSEALRAASQILVRLENVDRAVALAEADLKRSDSFEARVNYAEVLWRAARYDAAAQALRGGAADLLDGALCREVSRRFLHAVSHEPEVLKLGFDALRNAKFPFPVLACFVDGIAEKSLGLAFELEQQVPQVGADREASLLRAYAFLKRDKGEGPALSWIGENVAMKARYPLLADAFMQWHDELLWDFAEPAEQPQAERDWIWLLRTASLVRLNALQGEREKEVRAYFTEGKDRGLGLSLSLGRYLLGALSEKDLLPLADSVHNSARIAYYLGLKAELKGAIEEAHTWYRTAAETGLTSVPECRFAAERLTFWRNQGKALRYIEQKK